MDAKMIIVLMLYFESAEKLIQKEKSKDGEKIGHNRKDAAINFTLSTVLFLLVWSKQIILFMDLINIPHMVLGLSFVRLSGDTVARLVSLALAAISLGSFHIYHLCSLSSCKVHIIYTNEYSK